MTTSVHMSLKCTDTQLLSSLLAKFVRVPFLEINLRAALIGTNCRLFAQCLETLAKFTARCAVKCYILVN